MCVQGRSANRLGEEAGRWPIPAPRQIRTSGCPASGSSATVARGYASPLPSAVSVIRSPMSTQGAWFPMTRPWLPASHGAPCTPGPLNVSRFVAPYTCHRALSISDPVLHRTRAPRSSSTMAMVSHLLHFFNSATCQSSIQRLRWQDQPLPCPRCQSHNVRPWGDILLPARPATLPLESAGLQAHLQ